MQLQDHAKLGSWLQLELFDRGMIWGLLRASLLTLLVSIVICTLVGFVARAIGRLNGATKSAKG